MGQSALLRPPTPRHYPVLDRTQTTLQLAVFPTELGWFGLAGSDGVVHSLTIGHGDADEVRAAVQASQSAVPVEEDWHPRLRADLQAYARGEQIDFTKYRLALSARTEFQKRVLDATRRIPYGRTITYRALAEKVGCGRGARAVGNVMASNRIPILIPCHRVVASGGGMGGFSAPQGTRLKDHMLRMERGEL